MEKLEHGLNLTYIKCHLRKKNNEKMRFDNSI